MKNSMRKLTEAELNVLKTLYRDGVRFILLRNNGEAQLFDEGSAIMQINDKNAIYKICDTLGVTPEKEVSIHNLLSM